MHQHFAFLRRLRAAGRNNMYGAIPYLAREFGITREAAFASVCAFIDHDGVLPAPPAKPKAKPKKRRRK